jgi:hypothetical protein
MRLIMGLKWECQNSEIEDVGTPGRKRALCGLRITRGLKGHHNSFEKIRRVALQDNLTERV